MKRGFLGWIGLCLATALSGADEGVRVEPWGVTADGRQVELFTLTTDRGARVLLATYGALLVSVEHEGVSLTRSYRSLAEAEAGGVQGSIVGRFANRIDTGGFTIDGTRYELTTRNARTGIHIHGGREGLQRQVWEAESGEDWVRFTHVSPDGHEGFPGELTVSVTYRLRSLPAVEPGPGNELSLSYRATTTKPTHLNLTNHVYFNLAGGGDILDHRLHLPGVGEVLEFDARKIPTGRILPVEGTAFDFTSAARLRERVQTVGGFDHCFVVPGAPGRLREFGRLSSAASGKVLEVHTTQPGVQVYTANHWQGDPYPRWGGICFETQHYPDSPNHPEFPSTLLRPGEVFAEETVFRFGAGE